MEKVRFVPGLFCSVAMILFKGFRGLLTFAGGKSVAKAVLE